MILDIINVIRTFNPEWKVKDKFTPTSKKDVERFKFLINEEVKELFDELDKDDKEQRVLETIDAVYVVLQNLVEMGIDYNSLYGCFEEMRDSQYSKLCNNEETAKLTVALYKNGTHPHKQGHEIDCYYMKHGDKWIVRRTDNDKYLKSVYFKKPNIKRYIK